MALLGTYGGADDVRVQANRLGAPQAGGIYGGVGKGIPEMNYLDNNVIVTTDTTGDTSTFEVVGAPKPAGGDIPEVDDYNVELGTLSNSHWEWYIDDTKYPTVAGEYLSYIYMSNTVPTGKAISAVRQGVSSVTGKVIYHTVAPILGGTLGSAVA